MASTIYCWQCGNSLSGLILPMSRREECANCGAEQHVCKLCKDYNPQVSRSCSEDLAEDVTDKEKANFCDYFSPNPHAYNASKNNKQNQAKDELAKLFGEDSNSGNAVSDDANKTKIKNQDALSELEKLFGDDSSNNR